MIDTHLSIVEPKASEPRNSGLANESMITGESGNVKSVPMPLGGINPDPPESVIALR